MSRLSARHLRLDLQPFHRNRFDRIRSQFDSLRQIEEGLTERVGEAGGYLARDLWSSFVDGHLEADSSRSDFSPAIRRLSDFLFDSLAKSDEFETLRDLCRGSTFAAIEATEAAASFLKSLPLPEPPDNEAETTTASGDNGDSTSVSTRGTTVEVRQDRSGIQRSTSKEFDSVEEASEFAAKVIEQATSRGQTQVTSGFRDLDFEAALDEALDQVEESATESASLQAAARAAVRSAAKTLEDRKEMLAATFGDEEAERIFEDPSTEDLALVDRLATDKAFADFVRQVGRFVDSLRSAPLPEKIRGSLAVDGIETSKRFSNLLPSERVLLATPALRAYQTSRVLSGKALGYRRSEVGSRSSGDFLVALDTSHSMTIASRQWPAPAAFAAASAIVASDEGRSVSVVTFSTSIAEVHFDSESASGRSEFLRKMLSICPSGGTSFRPVIERADILAPFSDLLLISDGDGPLDEDRTREVFATRSLAYLVIGGTKQENKILSSIATQERTLVADSLTPEAINLVASFTR
jgi:uncharacterized protein with von Willebrand factor type A (vWA) domain